MYYIFDNDTIFRDNETTIQQGNRVYPACVVDKQVENYFYNPMIVNDPRPSRLTYNGQPIEGKISFYFDAAKYDDPIFSKMSTDELSALFSIGEFIGLALGKTADQINQDLIESPATSSIYIPDSVRLSPLKVNTVIYKLNSETDVSYSIQLPVYYEFSIKVKSSVENIDIRVYISRDYFLKNYPLSTISKVIEPCDHSYLLNPDKATSIVDMLIKSNEFTLSSMSQPVEDEDHTGLYVYKTKFIVNGTVQLLPFGILYQGAKPSVLEIRKAIREQLLSYGSAEKEVWEPILPDLFVVATWYMIPFWSNVYSRPTGDMYPSVGNLNKFSELVPKVFPELDINFIKDYEEFLVCGYNELFFAAIPDPLNESHFSIQKLHPTYQYHLAQDGTAFNNMDEDAKAFNGAFNNCVAVAMGETTSEAVSTNIINDMTWYTFTAGEVEYNLLSKESFNTKFIES